MLKPHNGPSAVLVLIATGNRVIQDATSFYGFGVNGSAVSNWLHLVFFIRDIVNFRLGTALSLIVPS